LRAAINEEYNPTGRGLASKRGQGIHPTIDGWNSPRSIIKPATHGQRGKKTISLLTHGLIISKERPRECNKRATAATKGDD